MSLLLVIQPDTQATALRDLLLDCVSGEVVVVDSIDLALSTIDQRMPDVILLPMLMAPAEEDHLMAYLGTIRGAAHVQTIRVPQLELLRPVGKVPAHSPFFSFRRRANDPLLPACNPRAFVRDVKMYLACAGALKEEVERRSDRAGRSAERRGERRWEPDQVPWVSVVRFAGDEQTDLVNVSLGGALLRTRSRPERELLKRADPHGPERPRLTFRLESGREVHTTGRVVRCCVGPMAGEGNQYEIAFSFDQSVGLDLPSEGLVRPADVDGFFGGSVGSDYGLSTIDTSEPLSRAGMEVAGNRW
jgi:hypothetical protein